ncbi:MAG: sigma-70 family RNA polymerase sigma factor [Bacteroidaceae bacterium]|nr:sigma-70 family RNA polymerase sigma factor [Bacteroidaceae bacterium]
MLDNRILEQLFRRNYSEMIHLARLLLGGGQRSGAASGMDEEAEDVVQDVFLRLADSDIPPKNDRYLLTAVHNACLNRIRQMRLHDQVKGLQPIEGLGGGAAAGMEEADFQPIDKGLEWLDEIAVFVDEQLEEPHRSIFHLRFDEDLTVSEIARRLGLNPNTTYKYLMQSIQRIRHHFKKH